MSNKGKRKSAMMTASVVPELSTSAIVMKSDNDPETSEEKKPKLTDNEKPSTSKERKTPEEIDAHMDNTFDVRRSFLTIEMPLIAAVRETCPYLFTGKQLLKEFQRITKIDIDHSIQEYCVQYAGAIIDIAKHTPGTSAIIRQSDIMKQEDASLRQYWDMVTALCLLPLLLKENIVEMVREISDHEEVDPKGKVVPMLISKGNIFQSDEFVLVAEEQVLQEFEEFTMAFATLFSSYWVFNMEYPKTLNNTYNFVQKVIIQQKDSTPTPPACKQLMHRLQKHIKQVKPAK